MVLHESIAGQILSTTVGSFRKIPFSNLNYDVILLVPQQASPGHTAWRSSAPPTCRCSARWPTSATTSSASPSPPVRVRAFMGYGVAGWEKSSTWWNHLSDEGNGFCAKFYTSGLGCANCLFLPDSSSLLMLAQIVVRLRRGGAANDVQPDLRLQEDPPYSLCHTRIR